MKRFLGIFLRFRWKLAFSGMLATAATMVVVSLVYMVVLHQRERSVLLRDDVPQRISEGLARFTAELRQPLMETPANIDAVDRWIASSCKWDNLWLPLDSGPADDCTSCDLRLELLAFAIVDPEGRVLSSRSDDPACGSQLRDGIPEFGQAVLARAIDQRAESMDRDPSGNAFAVVPFVALSGELRGLAYAEVAAAPPTLGVAARRFFALLPRGLLEILPFALILGTVFSVMTSRGLLRRLRRLNEASDAWSRGDFSVRVHDRSGDELGALGRALDEMADELGTLLQTRQELAALEERNHLARELHDTVKQEAFSISMLLGTVETLYRKDPERALEHVAEARELAGRAGRELNALIMHLRPASLEGKGLVGALREYCDVWSRKLGIESQLRVQGERSLPLELEQSLFRVAQEALANVAWHSGSKQVEVHLAIRDDGPGPDGDAHRMTLSVRDRGRGFDPRDAESRGFGLQGMRERMEQLGGRLRVDAEPGGGTLIVAECPIG